MTTKRHHTATAHQMKKKKRKIRQDNIFNAIEWGRCAGETEKKTKRYDNDRPKRQVLLFFFVCVRFRSSNEFEGKNQINNRQMIGMCLPHSQQKHKELPNCGDMCCF